MDPVLVTTGFVCAAAIAAVSLRLRYLTAGGAVAQFILGWMMFGLGGVRWAAPILVFFFASTALSGWSLRRRPTLHANFAKGATRDVSQVLANGGVAGACTVAWFFLGNDALYVAGVSAIASAAADTWGTEVGIQSRTRPRMVTTWRETEHGASGGVTLSGTSAGIAGALLVAAGALPWLAFPGHFAAVVLGGLSGSLFDSFLGATLQLMRRCAVCGRLTERREHCGSPAVRVRGFRWMTNDTVNFLCTAGGTLSGYFLSRLL